MRSAVSIGGALAGAMGGGSGPHQSLRGFALEVLETTEAELSLLQPSGRGGGSGRSDAGLLSTDLLLLLVSRPGGSEGPTLGGGGLRLVESSEREIREEVSCEALLSPGHYLALPLSLRPAHSDLGWPRTVLRVGSAKPLLCEEVAVAPSELAAAVGEYARRGSRHRAFDGMDLFSLQDG